MTATEPALDVVLAGVGPRLRALRLRKDLTLSSLARTTGISVSTLSRLESGGRKPTLELLLPVARAHGVALDELVGVPPVGDPRVRAAPIQQHGMTMWPLSTRPGGLQAYKLLVAPGHPRAEPDQKMHEGYDWLYVLSGRLRVVLGEHDLVLRPRRGRRVRHPDAALVRRLPTTSRSSCSRCSASRGSGCTYGHARRGRADRSVAGSVPCPSRHSTAPAPLSCWWTCSAGW